MTTPPLLTVVDVPLDDLTPAEDNKRAVRSARFKALVASVRDDPDFLRARPVIALPDGTIVAGERRWLAARAAGREDVPTVYADLDDDQRRVWMARDNEHAAEWEDGALAELMAGASDPAAAIMLAGYGADEVNAVLGLGEDPTPEPEPPSDVLPPMPDDPRTKRGDLIELGPHRLLCGDSTDPDDLGRLLGERQVDAVVMDPPYAIYGSSTGLAAEVADDKMVRAFFREVLRAASRAVKPFGHVYVCCDWRSWSSWWEVAKGTGIAPKNMIVWDKGGAGLGNNYANSHELIFYAAAMPKRTRMTKDETGQRPVLDANIWRIPRVAGGEERLHNAQKPVELCRRAVRNSTEEGERILDLFGGSGTTLMAAHELGREALLMEIDPAWCDVIVTRWEQHTGRKAKRPRRRK